jgi:hypothetical protein
MNKFWNWYDNLKEPWRLLFAVFVLMSPLHISALYHNTNLKYVMLLTIPIMISWLCYNPIREFKIGDRVSILIATCTKSDDFEIGHEFTISHIIPPYAEDDCINLKDDEGRELLFVRPEYLKLINHE